MQTTKQASAVVISLDAYRKRRDDTAAAGRDDNWQASRMPGQVTDVLAGIDLDEDKAEDARRLLTMPTAGRPDERELL